MEIVIPKYFMIYFKGKESKHYSSLPDMLMKTPGMPPRIALFIFLLLTCQYMSAYYPFSPYCYCMANPTNFTDPDGLTVIAIGKDVQDMIKYTLPQDAYEYLRFDENGILDANTLGLYTNVSESQNFLDLLTMASSSDYTFEVYLNQTYEYLDQKGISHEYTMWLEDDLDPNPGWMSSRTGEWGAVGHTNLPGLFTEYSNSTNGNIQIFINPQLSIPGRSQIFSHEGYGHGYLYMVNGGNIPIQEHRSITINRIQKETNTLLLNRINRAINETVIFMSR